MKKKYSIIFILLSFFASVKMANAQYCIPNSYYGSYLNGLMQLNAFSTSGGSTNISISPGNSTIFPGSMGANYAPPYNQTGTGYFSPTVTATQCVATPGTTITWSITTNTTYSQYYGMWIDWNQNGSFNDPGETIYLPTTYVSTHGTVITGTFTVPLTATVGLSRLRLMNSYYGSGNIISSHGPCMTYPTSGYSYLYGTTFDFNFIVSGPCSGVPSALSIVSPTILTPSCPGETTMITANETNYTTGLVTMWKQGPSAAGPFTTIQGANSLSYLASIADTTFFVALDSCTNSFGVSPPTTAYMIPVQKFPLPYSETFTSTTNGTAPSCYYYNDNNGTNFIVQSGLHSANGTTMKAMYANDPVSNATYGKNDFFTMPGVPLNANTVYAIRFRYARGRDNPFLNTGIAYPEHLQLFVNNYQPAFVVSNVTGGTLLFDQTINFDNVGDTTVYFAPLIAGGYYFSWYSNTAHPGGSTSSIPGGVVMVDSILVNTGTCVAPAISSQPAGLLTCIGNAATLNIATTGTGNNYQWQKNGVNIPGATNQNFTIPSLTLSDSGSYVVVVSNPCGTVTSSVAHLTVNPLPTASLSPSSPTTICSASGYTLSAGTNAGTPYYQWRLNGNTIGSAVGSTYLPILTGSYSVIVTDGNGCSQSSPSVALTVNQSPSSVITPGGSTVFCTGDSVTLFAPTGAGLTYQWYAGSSAIPSATSQVYTAVSTGNYTVQVSNAYCALTSPVQSVSVNSPPPANITSSGPTAICQGSSVALSVTSGTGYTYIWRLNGSPTAIATNADTVSYPGTYSVVVSIGSCSTTSSDVVVTTIALPSASITPSGTINVCSGSSATITAAAGSGYSYQWQYNGVPNANTAASQIANNSGDYNVVVTDSSTGCSSLSSTATINLVPLPSAFVTPGNTAICLGDNIVLSATIQSGYTYQWQNNGVNIPGALGATYTDNPTNATTYSVVITDANNCQNTSAPDTITVNQLPLAAIVPAGNTSFCPGGNVVLNANTGSNLRYQWQVNGASIPAATSISYTTGSSGAYTVIDTDITTGCFAASPVRTVTVYASPAAQVAANGPLSFCPGYNVVLSGMPSTAGYSYVWLNGTSVVGNNPTYATSGSGNFRVVVTDNSTSCFDTSTAVAVNLFSTPSNAISASGPTTFCIGSSVVLNVSVVSGMTYQWQLNGVDITAASSASYTATTAGSYSVVVSNGVCSASTAATMVSTNPLPPASVSTSGPSTFCSNQNITLSANLGVGLSYHWQRGAVYIVGSGATASAYTTDSSGNYTVVVTDANGCSASSAPPVTVSVNPAPHVVIICAGSPISCEGDSVHLYANTGGTQGLSYQWQNNGTNLSWGAFSSYYGTISGIYDVIVKSANGCYDTSAGFSLTINPRPVPVITASGNTLSTSSSYNTYQWYRNSSPISNAHGYAYTATQTGSYQVFVSDNSYCAGLSAAYDLQNLEVGTLGSSENNVRIYPNPATSIIHVDALEKVRMVISAPDGKEMLSESGASEVNISKLAAGVYVVRIFSLEGTLLKIEKLVKGGF